jgi:hypothetical protein
MAAALRLRMDMFGEIVRLEIPGFAMPGVEADYDDPDLPYRVHLTVAAVHGKPVCTGLTAERREAGQPVTRRGLNALPVEQIVHAVVAEVAMKAEDSPGRRIYTPLGAANAGPLIAQLAPRRGRRRDPAARQELTRKVVTAYRELLAADVRQPKPLIAKELSISTSTVGALLAEARQQGLLGAAVPGRAGEFPEPPHVPACTDDAGEPDAR